MNFEEFLKGAIKGTSAAPLPLHVTVFGRGYQQATQSITVPGTSELEIDLSKFAPGLNYKLQIVPLCPTEVEPAEPGEKVSD